MSEVKRLGLALAVLASLLSGCSTFPDVLPSAGPSREQVVEAAQPLPPAIRLVDVSDAVARRLADSERRQLFSETLTDPGVAARGVGPGDVLEVSVWEAPPALLFATAVLDARTGMAAARLPEQMISVEGSISVPFAGAVPVAGRTPQQIESEIVRRLTGKANQPQVLVRVIRNATSNVTVVGEVAQSLRMPLTPAAERLLDAIAAAGGVRQPVSKVTVQLTRGTQVQTLPLEQVIRNPKENVPLAPGDVLTVLFQPLSFTVLGATGRNEEVNFEAQGISLAQALARSGGLQDARADARGVFIFRFEDPNVMDESARAGPTTPDGKVPVVYRLDMKDPATFLVAQNFPMRNRDVIYVANAPAAELQKFLNILTGSIFSVRGLVDLGR